MPRQLLARARDLYAQRRGDGPRVRPRRQHPRGPERGQRERRDRVRPRRARADLLRHAPRRQRLLRHRRDRSQCADAAVPHRPERDRHQAADRRRPELVHAVGREDQHRARATQNTLQQVLVFGGGYDTVQDNGGYAPTASATRSSSSTRSRATCSGTAARRPTRRRTSSMPRSSSAFPGDIRVFDLTGDGYADRMYAGDMGGRVWRFDINNGQTARTWSRAAYSPRSATRTWRRTR